MLNIYTMTGGGSRHGQVFYLFLKKTSTTKKEYQKTFRAAGTEQSIIKTTGACSAPEK